MMRIKGKATPLQLAVVSGNVNIVRMLLKNGAIAKATFGKWRGQLSESVMHLAAIQCCHDMKKKNSNEPSLEIIDELLKFGANPSEGLHGAIDQHNIKVVRHLLEKGANPTFTDERGKSIDIAASVVIRDKMDDFSIINLLLQYGATVNLMVPNGKRWGYLQPALLQSMKPSCIELLRFLLANGGRRALNEKHSHATGKMFRPSDCSARDVLLEVGAKECGGFLAFESRDPNVLQALIFVDVHPYYYRPANDFYYFSDDIQDPVIEEGIDYPDEMDYDTYRYCFHEQNIDCSEILPARERSKKSRTPMHTKRPNCRKFRKPMRTCPIDYPVSGC
eukprot:TRINITY_DN323_c2_g1_i1.p1 TRINITY_DN323_c2_g1~~TRINITY_DN323_c2_g1_i1.p1  ORF type:complete len:334 (+),score=54.61 TRINITY_DN323_c2_g1_i1:65-1066(+)